jgi:hypothetical protein
MHDVIRDAGGFDAAKAKYGENAERWSTWSKLRAFQHHWPRRENCDLITFALLRQGQRWNKSCIAQSLPG